MLDIDIEAVEACGLGDARNLDAAHQPHRHRCDHLVPGEPLLDIIAQDVAYRHGWPSLLSCLSYLSWPYSSCDAMLPGSEQERKRSHELRHRLQVDPRPSLGEGVAGAGRSRRLLSPRRQIRH